MNTRLLHIGIKGYQVAKADIPAANLVFLIDVSGSMQSADKLELLKQGMKLLVKQIASAGPRFDCGLCGCIGHGAGADPG